MPRRQRHFGYRLAAAGLAVIAILTLLPHPERPGVPPPRPSAASSAGTGWGRFPPEHPAVHPARPRARDSPDSPGAGHVRSPALITFTDRTSPDEGDRRSGRQPRRHPDQHHWAAASAPPRSALATCWSRRGNRRQTAGDGLCPRSDLDLGRHRVGPRTTWPTGAPWYGQWAPDSGNLEAVPGKPAQDHALAENRYFPAGAR